MAADSTRVGLVEVLDHLLARGTVVRGRSTISLAGIDLVHLELSLLLSSVDTLQQAAAQGIRYQPVAELSPKKAATVTVRPELRQQPAQAVLAAELPTGEQTATYSDPPMTAENTATYLTPGPEGEQGLAHLVLVLVDLLRQLVERQAIRRVEGGTLSDAQVEEMGLALLELEETMQELKRIFKLDEDDLNIGLELVGSLR